MSALAAVPPELARNPDRVSVTFAQTFDDCPRSAMLGKQITAVGQPLSRGTVMHTFATRVVTVCVSHDRPQLANHLGRQLMQATIVDDDEHVDTEQQDVLLELAGVFCDSHRFDLDAIQDLEVEYAVDVEGSVRLRPGEPRTPFLVPLSGRPDLVELDGDVVTVTDYKTAFAVDAESGIGGTPQGRSYALMAFDRWPHAAAVRLRWDYVRFGDRGIREATITRDQLPALQEWASLRVGRIVKARVRDLWPAMPGGHCDYCPDVASCPLLLKERRGAPPIDQAMAHAYGDSIQVMEKVLKLRKQQVRDWVKGHGPLRVGNGQYELTLGADSYRIDDDAKAAMEAAGVDWREYAKRVPGSSRFAYRKGTTQKGGKA